MGAAQCSLLVLWTTVSHWSRIEETDGYRKASFLLPTEEIEGENDNEVSLENGVYVPPGMATEEFERYAAVDNDQATEADISESAIVSAIQLCDNQPSDNSEDDDDDVATQPASFAVAKHAVSGEHTQISGTEGLRVLRVILPTGSNSR